jgi:predicted DNA-binding ribbon-helix-helix protein
LTGFSDNLAAADGGSSRRLASENTSFRLQKVHLDQLREESKEKRISLNTLVSQIIDSYVNFGASVSKAGMIPISKSVLIELLEGYSEEQIKAIAKRTQEKIRIDRALQLRGRYNFEVLVDIFESWLKATGFSYRHNRDAENAS